MFNFFSQALIGKDRGHIEVVHFRGSLHGLSDPQMHSDSITEENSMPGSLEGPGSCRGDREFCPYPACLAGAGLHVQDKCQTTVAYFLL